MKILDTTMREIGVTPKQDQIQNKQQTIMPGVGCEAPDHFSLTTPADLRMGPALPLALPVSSLQRKGLNPVTDEEALASTWWPHHCIIMVANQPFLITLRFNTSVSQILRKQHTILPCTTSAAIYCRPTQTPSTDSTSVHNYYFCTTTRLKSIV